MTSPIHRSLRFICLVLVVCSLSACVYWMRAYQVYLQMSEFDRYFDVVVGEDFSLQFKKPVMLSEDFVSLSRLHASEETTLPDGKKWRYWFRKVNGYKKPVTPEVKFYSELIFNKENKLTTLGQPQIAVEKAAPGNPFIYKATVSVLPTVKVARVLKLSRDRVFIVVSLLGGREFRYLIISSNLVESRP